MLKFGNKEFRNLQEQVEENMKDIQDLKQGVVVLDEFGIKVIGEVASVDDMPTVEEYKEEHENWEYGDSYAVGTEPPYTMYILTRGNNENPDDYWFNIGIFPMPGPQGEQGIQGETGPQGQTGETGPAGVDAGFGTPTASVTQYSRGTEPTVSVEASGSNTEKVFSFAFGIPSGAPSVTLTSVSGTLTLSQFNMLQNQPDSVILQRVSAGASIVFYTLQRWYKSEDYMYFICLYNYTPYKTSFRVCQVDLHNRNYTLTSDVAMKVGKYNISSYDPDISGNATSGKVLTADGSGGVSWEDAGSGISTITLNSISGTLSDSDYIKVAGDGCTIIYNDNTSKVSLKKQFEDSTSIVYTNIITETSNTYIYGVTITKSTKAYEVQSGAIPITTTSIKSGLETSGKYLTTDGSGGTSWTSGPSFTQVQSDWDESSQSSPAYIKNKPTIPTVPVTDVKVDNVSVLNGTVAEITMPTIPTKVSDLQNDSGFITGITSSDVTTALGYTPYNSSNPNGYTSNVGTVTSVNNVSPVNGDVTIAIPPTITITTTSGSESVSDGTNTLSFGSNAFNSTSIPSVSGTNDGTNWTSLTINSDTYNIGGGSTPSNMVTTDTAQTISGWKTLTGATSFKNGTSYYYNDGLVGGIGADSNGLSITGTPVLIQGYTHFKTSGSDTYKISMPSTTSITSDKTIATTDQIPDAVSGTNDGTNWTTLTIGSVTKNIPAGGSGSGVSDVTIDGTSIVSNNVAAMTTETWTFTLSNGNTVTKKVVLG